MTLPSSPPLSMAQVLAELRTSNPGRGLPLSLNDADVRALAGRPSGFIQMADLLGKSVSAPLSVQKNNGATYWDSTNGGGQASTPVSVTVLSGTAPFSYSWAMAPGSDPRVSIINGQGTSGVTVTASFGRNTLGQYSVLVNCTVTDGAGKSITVSPIADAEWGSNL